MPDDPMLSLQRGPSHCAPPIEAVREFYEALPEIQPSGDRWLKVQNDWIQSFVEQELCIDVDALARPCLNLGSGGLSYGLSENALLHVDVDHKRVATAKNVVIADIQRLPIRSGSCAAALCVGSVLNHCDAAAVIAGVGSALASDGRFVLEFETSASLELLGSRHFNKSATVIRTFYQGHRIKLWAYSEPYVRALLAANGLSVRRRSSCHHLSPLVYGLCRNSSFAARFHVLDYILRHVPLFKQCACHVIYSCQKVG